MKLVSFHLNNRPGYGAVVGDRVVDLSSFLADVPDLASLIASPGKLAQAKKLAAASEGELVLADLTLSPVIPAPGKIICVGINYVAHAEEAGRKVGQHPVIFQRFAETLQAHDAPLVLSLIHI